MVRVTELATSNAFLGVRLAAINFLLNLSIETSSVFRLSMPSGWEPGDAGRLYCRFYGMSFRFVVGVWQTIRHPWQVAFVRLGLGALAYSLRLLHQSVLLVARAFVGLCLDLLSGRLCVRCWR